MCASTQEKLRPSLAELRLRLQNRLQPEPCQTVDSAAASRPELHLEPLADFTRETELGKGGSTRLLLSMDTLVLAREVDGGSEARRVQRRAGLPAQRSRRRATPHLVTRPS